MGGREKPGVPFRESDPAPGYDERPPDPPGHQSVDSRVTLSYAASR
jgi:hypothetical protein